MAAGVDDGWVPTARDFAFGSEEACYVLVVMWSVAARSYRSRLLVVSTLVVALSFELVATRSLGILTHNPVGCKWWWFTTVPTAVLLSWCAGMNAHMRMGDRFKGFRWFERAAADVCVLSLMDIMTEVGGIRHNCWRWSQQDFASVASGLQRHVPTLLTQPLWWGVPAFNYSVIPGVVLCHSLLMRYCLDTHAKRHTALAVLSILALPVVVGLWIYLCIQMSAVVGPTACAVAVLGGCVFVTLGAALREINFHWRVRMLPPVAWPTTITIAGCYVLNTSRLLTLPDYTATQLAVQAACIATSCVAMYWSPATDRKRKPT